MVCLNDFGMPERPGPCPESSCHRASGPHWANVKDPKSTLAPAGSEPQASSQLCPCLVRLPCAKVDSLRASARGQ